MAVRYTIRVSKSVLAKSLNCGSYNQLGAIEENCAIAISLHHLFPSVRVTKNAIHPFGRTCMAGTYMESIELPKVARDFINVFDSLVSMPHLRLLLPEFDFEISIPDKVLSRIDISEIKAVIEEEAEIPELESLLDATTISQGIQ
ncbi:MAG: hypothetical protein KGM98_14100 [Bacteroidota bacterium]|nr:hypothetical protein [Bacteroidota bacterium]